MLDIKKLSARIESVDTYSGNLKVFRLRLPEDSSFSFVPGQFVMVSIPGLVDKNGRPVAKSYSIASSPSETGAIEMCIAKFETGALSPLLFKAKTSDEVIITGPYGVFKLKSPVAPGTVFIAGGTGLAPLMSMIRYLYNSGHKEKLWLFYSVGEPSLFLFKDELMRYQKSNGLKLVVSTSNPNSDWQWEKGRASDTFPKYLQQLNGDEVPKELRQFYVCGPPVMVKDTITMLEQLGFRKENIHKEQW